MPKLVNNFFCRGLLLALIVLPLTWPGLAKANSIPVPVVTQWEWEFDKVGCDGGAICTWENTIFISANVAPGIFDYALDIFADFSLTSPDGTPVISNLFIPLSFTSPGLLGYFDFSGDGTFGFTASSSFQLGAWTGFGFVCAGAITDGYCDFQSTPQSATFKVPEPTTLALFGLGLAGLGVLARRRRKFAQIA